MGCQRRNPESASKPHPIMAFQTGTCFSPSKASNGHNARFARVDPAHTWSIVGIGKDLCASTILLCTRIGLFGNGSVENCLKRAYNTFQSYLDKAGKYSSIDDFSHRTLKCGKSWLASSTRLFLNALNLMFKNPSKLYTPQTSIGTTISHRDWEKGMMLPLLEPG